jgi:prepilin-type N-terminal cleavage/methylation domain-containing protein
MKRIKRQSGLTLLELLIAIALITITVSMVVMATKGSWTNAEKKVTQSVISLLDSALEDYHESTGEFPAQGLITSISDAREQHNASLYVQLSLDPESKKILDRIADSQIVSVSSDIQFIYKDKTYDQQSYMKIVDAWKTPLDYRYDPVANNFPTIISAGPDKKFDTTDDITNKK